MLQKLGFCFCLKPDLLRRAEKRRQEVNTHSKGNKHSGDRTEGSFLSESESVSRSIVSDSCDRKDCRSTGSSVHGILQARILEWVAVPFSRGSSQTRDRTWVSHIVGRFLLSEPLGKTLLHVCVCVCVVYSIFISCRW